MNGREKPPLTAVLKKLAIQWLNQVQFSNETFVPADSFALRNRQVLVSANRYAPLKRPTVNHIDKIRTEIIKNFNEKTFQKGEFETFLSPSKKFRLEATNFWLKEPNWDLTKVEIYDQEYNKKIFDFFVNESRFFHGWVNTNKVEYLICAEDIFGGQTIVDLTNQKMAGYSPNEDGFIWTDFHLSPDGKTLATIGCYWACPYVIKLFDFSDPLNLPLKEMNEIPLLGNNEIIICWLDNDTIQLSLSESETVKEEFEDGLHAYKIVTKPIEKKREIKMNIRDKPF